MSTVHEDPEDALRRENRKTALAAATKAEADDKAAEAAAATAAEAKRHDAFQKAKAADEAIQKAKTDDAKDHPKVPPRHR